MQRDTIERTCHAKIADALACARTEASFCAATMDMLSQTLAGSSRAKPHSITCLLMSDYDTCIRFSPRRRSPSLLTGTCSRAERHGYQDCRPLHSSGGARTRRTSGRPLLCHLDREGCDEGPRQSWPPQRHANLRRWRTWNCDRHVLLRSRTKPGCLGGRGPAVWRPGSSQGKRYPMGVEPA